MQPSGGMLWRFKFRIDGRDAQGAPKKVEKKLGLGTYPEVSLKDARDLREDARALLAKGIAPAEKKRRDIHTAKVSAATVLDRRDRALVAFAALTGARVNALVSFRIGHVDLAEGKVFQDAREVRTKFAKSFPTFFMPIGGKALEIVEQWLTELTGEHLKGPADPLFPATAMGLGENGGFTPTGLAAHGWATSAPVRDIFRGAFAEAGLPYYNPHSFRDMLVRHAMKLDLSPEQMKAWSQNLGHADVLTTFTSYGSIPSHRQGELIRTAANDAHRLSEDPDVMALIRKIADKNR